MDTDPTRIEEPVSFANSKFWELQRNYFATMGEQAWATEVPMYISSNMFIGQRYAQLIINFLKDWLALHPQVDNEPFYILELGAGTGRFSYCFLSALKELLKLLKLDLKFCYVISDFTQKNIDYCRNSEPLQPFIAAQEIDFTLFNVETSKDFYLELQQKNYSQLQSKKPLIVIANYTFDCIKQAILEYSAGKWYELHLGLRSRYKNFDTKKVKHLNDLRFENNLVEISIDDNYPNPILNNLIKSYEQYFKDASTSSLMLPLGALDFVENIKNLTTNNFFMVVGDKGISQPELFPFLVDTARVTYDGCYSFVVNFHAIGEYIKAYGGTYLLTHKAGSFKINLYSMGTDLAQCPQTQACFELLFERDGPDGYCALYEEFYANSYRFTLRTLISFLKYSQYDPEAYMAVVERLLELLPEANEFFMEEIKLTINKIKMHTFADLREDIFNGLGRFYHKLGMYDEALALYQRSIKHYGDKGPAHHNIAMVYEKQKNYPKALQHYEVAYNVNKNDHFAKRKIYVLSGKPFISYFTPIFKGALLFGLLALGIFLLQR